MTLTKQEMVKNLMDKLVIEKEQAKDFIDSFFESVRCALASGEDVKLSGFGNFELRHKSSRPGRNPKTGESVPVTARRVVVFKAGQKLRNRVEKTKPQA